jgi:5'-3' exoribonuclease 1
MGIPLYFKTLTDRYSDIIVDNIRKTDLPNFLFLDLNCAIHPCCRNFLKNVKNYNPQYKHDYERKMINSVQGYIKRLIEFVNPELCFIAIDGVAPAAKMSQQRLRRFKTVLEKEQHQKLQKEIYGNDNQTGWDTNAISPGTEFMDKLKNSIISYIKSKEFDDVDIVFSSANVYGEGEHKIFEFIRETPLEGNIVIYGLDADLIMLSMAANKDDIYLLRESVEYNKVDMDRLLYMDIEELKHHIKIDIKSKYFEIESKFYDTTLEEGFINDYIFLCFLLGNDFIPHSLTLDLRHKGIENIINFYLHGFYNFKKNLVSPTGKVDEDFFRFIIKKISESEDHIVSNLRKTRERMRPRAGDYTNSDPRDNEYQRRLDVINNLPITDRQTRESEKTIGLGTKGWRERYYDKTMGFSSNEDTEECVYEYLRGLKWAHLYYYKGCASHNWYYPYLYAPTFRDIYLYLEKNRYNDLTFQKGLQNSPVVQLLSIMPRESSNLLPSSAQKVMNDSESPLFLMYPDEYKLSTLFKRYYWQCVPKLPNPDFGDIKTAVKSLRLTSKEKARFKKDKNVFKPRKNQDVKVKIV